MHLFDVPQQINFAETCFRETNFRVDLASRMKSCEFIFLDGEILLILRECFSRLPDMCLCLVR